MDRTQRIDPSNTSDPTPGGWQLDTANRSRRMVVTAIVILIASLIALSGLGLLAAEQPSINLTILAALLAAPILCTAAVLQSARTHNLASGNQWVIAGIASMTFWITMASVLIVDVFPGLGITAYFMVILYANLAMDQRQVRGAILWVMGAFLAARAIGLFITIPPLELPVFSLVTNGAVAAFATLLLILLWAFFRSLNLVSKLTGAMIILMAVLAVVMSIAINDSTTAALQKSAGENLLSLARSQATAAGDLLVSQIDALTAFGVSDPVQREVKTTNSSYPLNPTLAKQELERRDAEWREAANSESSVSLLVNSRLATIASQDLKEFVRVFPEFAEVIITDQAGGLVGASALTRGYDYSGEEWWQEARYQTQNQAYISVPFYDLFTRSYIIRLGLPVYARGTNTLIGVIGATYHIQGLYELVSRSTFGETGEADLLFTGAPARLIHGDGLAEVSPEFVSSLDAIGDESFQMDYRGYPSLVGRTPITSSTGSKVVDNLGWAIIAHQDTAEAFAPVESQMAEIFQIVAVLTTLLAGLSTFLAQFITGPVTRLRITADTIRRGDFAARAVVENNDEIGLLASTLNEMTGQLSETLTGLEQRVAERTRELALSGEVGQALSQEHNLHRLLQEAVDRIQQAFDLYYVQIYLTDTDGLSLVMQAGSGKVGRELQENTHRLGIGPGSINGSAAAGKKAMMVRDTSKSSLFRPNPLLPETRAELAVPLMAGDRVIGVLDMQSSRVDILLPESLPAFESLAGQLAVAVDNAYLFSQIEASRESIEAQIRLQTHSGWERFLDAIHRGESLGYRYDREQRRTLPWTDAPHEMDAVDVDTGCLEAPIIISGETVGAIALLRENGSWSAQEQELVSNVAVQVARQIDGLRLLAQADQYRAEAELAARRLTREGWEEFLANRPMDKLQFVYDQNQVRPAGAAKPKSEEAEKLVVQPLVIQGEPVGEIAVEGVDHLDAEGQELMRTVSARLSDHLESLRLVEQTQEALMLAEQSEAALRVREQNLQNQNEAIGELTRSAAVAEGDIEQALQEITETAARTLTVERSSVWLYNSDRTAIRCVDLFEKRENRHSSGIELRRADFPAYFGALKEERVILAENAHTDPATFEFSEVYLKPIGIDAMLDAPIWSSGQVIGVVCNEHIGGARRWLTEEENFASSIADIVTLAYTANERKNRALQEQRIRQVSTEVLGAADLNTVMRRAVEQIGRVLGAPAYIYVGQTNGNSAATQEPQPVEAQDDQEHLDGE